MKLIENWLEKSLTCKRCGTTKSVKYESNGDVYCNSCIVFVEIGNGILNKNGETYKIKIPE